MMKKNDHLNEINNELEKYKPESETISDFINDRMKNNYRLKSLNYKSVKDNNVSTSLIFISAQTRPLNTFI